MQLDWLGSPVIVDLIVAVLLLEVLAFALFARRWSRAFRVTGIFSALAGICLLLAMRAAMTDAPVAWIGLALLGALAAHLADLRWRLRHTPA